MRNVQVVEVKEEEIVFDNGMLLGSYHDKDCCESHYLCFKDLTLSDFEGLIFDIGGDSFFKRIKDYGLELIPTNGHSVKVPGYGYNNGYYSEQLDLVIMNGTKIVARFDVTECQKIED